MSYMVPVQEEGLVVLATHRLLKGFTLTPDVVDGLKRFFDLTELKTLTPKL